MSTEIIVSVISLLGTIVGSLGGVLVSSRLTTYRIQKLEEKVAKHNNLIERMYKVEDSEKRPSPNRRVKGGTEMKINWKVRFKNPVFWFNLAASIFLPMLACLGFNWEDMTSCRL